MDKKTFQAKLKKLLKIRAGHLIADGNGVITNGHWLMRMKDDVFDMCMDGVELKEGIFHLKKSCLVLNDGIVVGDEANIPHMEAFIEQLDDKHRESFPERALDSEIMMFQSFVEGHGWLDTYRIKGNKFSVKVRRDYIDLILGLASVNIRHVFPGERSCFELQGDNLSPINHCSTSEKFGYLGNADSWWWRYEEEKVQIKAKERQKEIVIG